MTRRTFLLAAALAPAQSMPRAVFVQAGRRVDAPGATEHATEPRFPLAHVDAVRRRIVELFDRERPLALVSGAACGSDLLALEIAGQKRIRRVVLLSSAPEEYRKTSVVDRPGDWGPIFDRLLKEVRAEVVPASGSQEAYLAVNLKLLDRAQELARRRRTSAVALVVWNGKPRGADDVTEHFRANAKSRGLRIVEIPTL